MGMSWISITALQLLCPRIKYRDAFPSCASHSLSATLLFNEVSTDISRLDGKKWMIFVVVKKQDADDVTKHKQKSQECTDYRGCVIGNAASQLNNRLACTTWRRESGADLKACTNKFELLLIKLTTQ